MKLLSVQVIKDILGTDIDVSVLTGKGQKVTTFVMSTIMCSALTMLYNNM